MNILLERGLPETVDGVPLYADFRNMIRYELILQDEALTEQEKIAFGLHQLFDELPGTPEYAATRLAWFYGRGLSEEPRGAKTSAAARAYDFERDANLIYAGFYAAYGINLCTIEFLHWWEFMALLEGLPESTQMSQVMHYRTVDISQITDKNMRKHYQEMRSKFALESVIKQTQDVQEISRRNKDRVAQRFAEAEVFRKQVR